VWVLFFSQDVYELLYTWQGVQFGLPHQGFRVMARQKNMPKYFSRGEESRTNTVHIIIYNTSCNSWLFTCRPECQLFQRGYRARSFTPFTRLIHVHMQPMRSVSILYGTRIRFKSVRRINSWMQSGSTCHKSSNLFKSGNTRYITLLVYPLISSSIVRNRPSISFFQLDSFLPRSRETKLSYSAPVLYNYIRQSLPSSNMH